MNASLLLSRLLLLKACCLLFVLNSFSQNDARKIAAELSADKGIKSFSINETLGTPSFISFARTNDSPLPLLLKYFGSGSPAEEFRSLQMTRLPDGLSVQRFKMYFQGIPVEHSSFIVTSRNNTVLS